MSRARFAVILLLVALLVGLGAFAGALQVLDDGEPDPPPRSGGSATSVAPPADGSTTVPTTAAPPAVGTDLATPAWVAVVASEASEVAAQGKADRPAAAGYPTGVLHSDDYGSLKPGLWVAYAGPYPDRGAADDAVEALAADGFSGAYSRCVGSKEECRGDD
jgi:hypothetical protein